MWIDWVGGEEVAIIQSNQLLSFSITENGPSPSFLHCNFFQWRVPKAGHLEDVDDECGPTIAVFLLASFA